MSEKQEICHVVMKKTMGKGASSKPIKVFDDRQDARDYRRHQLAKSKRYGYAIVSVKKG